MTASDLEQLLDMGFEKERAELAVKQTGGLQGALEWLELNQDKSLEDIQAESSKAGTSDAPDLQPGEEARSLVCNECGKTFRSQAQAEFHASKTEHTDFSESTAEVAPLTEEQKEAKLKEAYERLAEKRAAAAEADRIDKKRNEEIRRKSTKEQSDAKEALQIQQQIKEAQAKKREKIAEIEAKKRIQAKIAADKEERRLKAEREKAARDGNAEAAAPAAVFAASTTPAASKSTAGYTEARLRLQTPNGSIQKTFPADTTLFEVAHAIAAENGHQVQSFSLTFPRKVFDESDFGITLKEAGMVPSAALIVK